MHKMYVIYTCFMSIMHNYVIDLFSAWDYYRFTEFLRLYLRLRVTHKTQINLGRVTMKTTNTKKYVLSIICILIGVGIALIKPPGSLTVESMRYLGIFMTAILMLILQLYPAPLVALFACVAFVSFHVCTFPEAFSAWSGDTMWTVILMMIFATGISKTGLIDRIAFNIIKFFPSSYTGMVVAIMATSTILSPVVPNSYSKCAVLGPFASAVAKANNIEKESKAAAGLFCAFYVPAAVHTMAFLTGSAMTFVLIGMMGKGYSFSWGQWFLCSSIWFIVNLILTFVFILVYCKPKEKLNISKELIHQRIAELKPFGSDEKAASIILAVSILLWITGSYIGIKPYTVAALAFAAMFLKGIFTMKDFQDMVPWGGLITLVASLLSISAVLNVVGINEWLASVAAPVIIRFIPNIYVFIIVLCITAYLLRYLECTGLASLAIIAAIFLPIGASLGIHPFITLFADDLAILVWNLSFHNPYYLQAEAVVDGLIVHKNVVSMSYAYMVIHIVGLLASVPLWKYLGMC